MASELSELDKWIVATLGGDAVITAKIGAGKVFKNRARASVAPPYIRYHLITGPDNPGQGTTRIQSRPQIQICVVTRGAPTDDTEAVVDRIDELIGKARAQTTPGGTFKVSARRQMPLDYEEPHPANAAEFYIHRGGIYQCWVSRSAAI